MPEVSVPWGPDNLTFTLPAHWEIQQVASPLFPLAAADWQDRLAAALHHPVAGESLARLLAARRAGRIVLVVEDLTRHSPVGEILEVVMREIRHAGIGEDQLEIFFATGTHPPLTARQASEKLAGAAEAVAWRSNPWDDRNAYVRVGQVDRLEVLVDRGVADADLRIVISSVSPHLQAGFGGGYKMLLPGAAHLDTVRRLHRSGITRRPRQLVGLDAERNPMRRLIDAGGQMVDARRGKTFAIQYLLDVANTPSAIVAGEVMPTYRMVAKQCSVACEIVTPGPADVVITNAHPRDRDLWQCFKCIPNTLWAARRGGVIIVLARAPAGTVGMDIPSWRVKASWMRRFVRMLGAQSLASLITRIAPRLAGDAAFFIRMALQTIHRNPVLMVSPRLCESGSHFPGLGLYPTVEDAVAQAEKLLRAGPQRVTVFPAGGTTFPVPTTIGPRWRHE